MIDQEKELADFLKDIYYNAPYVGDEFIETAKRIIAKYPQILAVQALDGIPNRETINDFSGFLLAAMDYKRKIQILIREVK